RLARARKTGEPQGATLVTVDLFAIRAGHVPRMPDDVGGFGLLVTHAVAILASIFLPQPCTLQKRLAAALGAAAKTFGARAARSSTWLGYWSRFRVSIFQRLSWPSQPTGYVRPGADFLRSCARPDVWQSRAGFAPCPSSDGSILRPGGDVGST